MTPKELRELYETAKKCEGQQERLIFKDGEWHENPNWQSDLSMEETREPSGVLRAKESLYTLAPKLIALWETAEKMDKYLPSEDAIADTVNSNEGAYNPSDEEITKAKLNTALKTLRE